MPKDEDTFFAGLIGGAVGYIVGAGKNAGWDSFIKNFNERLSHLAYSKIRIPYGFFKQNNNSKIIYAETVYAHLSGFPNIAIPSMIRVLEIALKKKYAESVSKEMQKDLNLFNLIEWAENHLGNKKDIAHGFRILRNNIHEDKLFTEADSMETIRHASDIINILYPYDSANVPAICPTCRVPNKIGILWNEKCNLGAKNSLQCDSCSTIYFLSLIP